MKTWQLEENRTPEWCKHRTQQQKGQTEFSTERAAERLPVPSKGGLLGPQRPPSVTLSHLATSWLQSAVPIVETQAQSSAELRKQAQNRNRHDTRIVDFLASRIIPCDIYSSCSCSTQDARQQAAIPRWGEKSDHCRTGSADPRKSAPGSWEQWNHSHGGYFLLGSVGCRGNILKWIKALSVPFCSHSVTAAHSVSQCLKYLYLAYWGDRLAMWSQNTQPRR